jgi:glycosyltransferase involved in cell wall biosynthesis
MTVATKSPAEDARLLLLCDRFPADLASGRHLRRYHFCRELARSYRCFMVDFGDERVTAASDGAGLAIEERRSLPSIDRSLRSPLRHLRWSNARLLERVWPEYYRRTLDTLKGLAVSWNIDGVIVLSQLQGELAVGLGRPRILDRADSNTLTRRRTLGHRGHDFTWVERQMFRLGTHRQSLRERYLLRNFDVTMTISEADRAELLDVSGVAPERVVVVANGVADAALAAGEVSTPRARSVAFWGNLDFPPNWTAVEFFNREVFLPHLAPVGVAWSIYGRNPGPDILRIAEHPLVTLHGYCPDLFAEAGRHGVMINPMVEGSGLKNKVLEAFAMRLPVVSTARGVEALPVTDGRECRITDDPGAFAEAVLALLDDPEQATRLAEAARDFVTARYTWRAIGRDLEAVVQRVLGERASSGPLRAAS